VDGSNDPSTHKSLASLWEVLPFSFHPKGKGSPCLTETCALLSRDRNINSGAIPLGGNSPNRDTPFAYVEDPLILELRLQRERALDEEERQQGFDFT
jgi:hypothetical protein